MSGDSSAEKQSNIPKESTERLDENELKILRNLFIRAQRSGQRFGPYLIDTHETDINTGGSLNDLIQQRVNSLILERKKEDENNISMEEYKRSAEERARISFEADNRIRNFRQALDILSWPYARSIRGLTLELHNMRRKTVLPGMNYKIETDTTGELDGGYHIKMDYQMIKRSGFTDAKLQKYMQNLSEGATKFEDIPILTDPRLIVSFKSDGEIQTISFIYKSISSGSITNLSKLRRRDKLDNCITVLKDLVSLCHGGHNLKQMTLDFGDAETMPTLIIGNGDYYDKINTSLIYTYNPETDEFELTTDKEDEYEAKNRSRVTIGERDWGAYYKRRRSGYTLTSEKFIDLCMELTSLIPMRE